VNIYLTATPHMAADGPAARRLTADRRITVAQAEMIAAYVLGYVSALLILCTGLSLLTRTRPRMIIRSPRNRKVTASVRWFGASWIIAAGLLIAALTTSAFGYEPGFWWVYPALMVAMGACLLIAAWTADRHSHTEAPPR